MLADLKYLQTFFLRLLGDAQKVSETVTASFESNTFAKLKALDRGGIVWLKRTVCPPLQAL